MEEKERGPRREYRTDQIAVQWEPEYCIHSANCIRSLPEVFIPTDRPWVHVDRATADAVAEAIMRCPTGALHFRRLDGQPQEPVPEATTIRPVPNGPLFVRGNIEIRGENGDVFRHDTRMALCHCGKSRHKPFCDNTHRLVAFSDPGLVARPPAGDEPAG
jgi:uncharacterized Fe-S cluster protein YjdI/CDGSH-type Zn-finger protein